MKRLLIVLGSLAGILLLALLLAGYFIARLDPNVHKQEIEQAFLSATGRPLHLNGNIELSLLPRLGLGVDQLSVDNAAGFGEEPLLTVAHARLSIRLWPLLHSAVEIGTVQLSGVHINPQVSASGSNNWTLATATNASSETVPKQNNASLNKLSIGGIDISEASVVYDNRQSLTHHEIRNLNLRIGEIKVANNNLAMPQFAFDFDDSHISGNARIDDPATLQGSFVIDIDAINLDRYLTPGNNTTKANPTDATKPLPLALLRNVNLEGSLNIGQLGINGLKLTNIKIPLQSGKGVITLNPVTASLYGGSFSGNLGLDVAGNGNIELALTSHGNSIDSLKRSLDGTGKLLDLPQGGETKFDNFSATLAIAAGLVHSNDLLIKAPGWQVTGTGTLADLRNDSLDFDLLATVDPTTATVANQKYDIGGHKLPIACGGSFNSPRCLPDAKAILKDAVAKPARELLDKALNRLLR